MYTPSFWEKETIFSKLDVCIIGSGIVGLSSAYYLKSKAPHLKIMVVDRGFLPYGASTRNAGFACFGSLTELIDDCNRESLDEVLKRVTLRWNGLQKLRNLLGDAVINYEPFGGYEVFTGADRASFEMCLHRMTEFNNLLKTITGISNTYADADHQIKEFGFNNVSHLIKNQCEGQIDTGKMMEALVKKVRDVGVMVINGLSINAIENENNEALLNTVDNFKFKARRVLIANNGFAATLLPELNVKPARAQVLVSKPISNLKIKGSFHYDQGYYYFRNIDNRILFGGGRNLDFKGEETTQFGVTDVIQNKLIELLNDVILPRQPFEIEMKWSGIMGVGESKSAIVKNVEGNVFCAVRMGGMGVAIGSVIGEQGANMILESL